jgi:exonuclease SbcC
MAELDERLAGRQTIGEQLRASLEAAGRAEELAAKRRLLEGLTARRSELQSDVDAARSDLQLALVRALVELEEVDVIPAQLEALRRDASELSVEVERIQGLHRSRDEVRAAGTEQRLLRDAALVDVERLRHELATVEERRRKVSSTGDGICPTCGSRLTDEHRATMVSEYTEEMDAIMQAIEARESEIGSLREACELLAARFRSYESAISQANGAAGHHAQAMAEIARLEALLTEAGDRRKRVRQLERRLKSNRFADEAQRTLAGLDAEIAATGFDQGAFEEARLEAGRADGLRRAIADLEADATRRDQVESRLAELLAEIVGLADDVETGASLAPLRARLDGLERERLALGYDSQADERLALELATVADAPAAMVKLTSAERDLDSALARLEELTVDADASRAAIAETRAALAAVAEALAGRPALAAALAEVSTRRRAADAAVEDAQGRLGGLREKLARCDLDRALLTEEQAALKGARHASAVSRHLRQAFGAHGIPSLIIEDTLPEIEERANDLLGRLSGDRTRISLETVKATRAGGSKDTLEIRITDEHGAARPYETYSGGEAFRVNFALRIALAQLLADRAGVRLRTLVVDEGFGTQDQEGRQSLVEAIGVIQADFDKVLVISHLDEIKDAFPVRIEVSKSPLSGSTFAVVGAA